MDIHSSQFEPLRSPEQSQAQPPKQGAALLSLGGLFFAQLAALTALGSLLLAAARDLPFSPETPATAGSIGASVGYFTGSFFIGKALSEFLWELLRGVVGEKTSLNASTISNMIMLLLSGYAKDQRWFCIGLLLLGSSCGLLRPGLAGLNWVEVGQREKILNYLYIFAGLGALAGPFIGSQLHSLFETNKLFKTTICFSGLMLATLVYYNIVFKDPATSSQRDFKQTASGSPNAHPSQSHFKAYTSAFLSHGRSLMTLSSLNQNKPRLLLYLSCGVVWSVKVLDWLLLPLWIGQARQFASLSQGINQQGPQMSILQDSAGAGRWLAPNWFWGFGFLGTIGLFSCLLLAEMKWGRVFSLQLQNNAQLHIASILLIALITCLPWACAKESHSARLAAWLTTIPALKDALFVFWFCSWSRSFPTQISKQGRETALGWGLFIGHMLLVGLSQGYPRLLGALAKYELTEKHLGSYRFMFLHASLALLLVLATLILRAIPFSAVDSTPRPNTDVELSRIEEPSVDQPNIDLSVSHVSTTEDENTWGQYPKIIENLSLEYPIIGGTRLEGKPEFAHKHVVVQNSSWRQTHLGIQDQFTDKDFGQLTSSLIGWGALEKPGDQEKINKMLKYSFDRPPASEKWQLIGDGVSPHDVFQGELGDCYFLSALSAAAVHPHRILRLMMQRGNSPKSAYCAAFCITGAWVEVIVDDRFPIRQDRVFPFCSAGVKKFWPMLLEKAYAKLYGGYWHIGCGGQALESLRDITGAPTEQIILKDAKDEATAFKRLKEAYSKGYIVTVGSKGEGEVKSVNGVIMGHAYSFLAAITLSNGQELLKLRNPWGKGEWKGDWGDKSSKWTPGLKREVGWTDKDDGISFMAYADFKENFDAISIARCHDSYYYSYLKTQAPDLEAELMQFTVAEAGEYYVGVSQKSKFFYPQLANFEYVYMSAVIIKREDDGSFTYVGEFGKQQRDPWVQLQLQPGTYWAWVYANWIFSNEIDYTFWTYGKKNTVIMKVVDQRSREGMTQVLADVFSKAANTSEEKWNDLFLDPQTNIPRCRSKCVKSKSAYGYYIFENQSTKNQVFTVTVTKSGDGVWLIYPQVGMTGANLKINPGESKMVIYRIQKQGFQVNFATNYQLG